MLRSSNVRFGIAPVATALFPVVYLYAHNIESVSMTQTVRPAGVVFAGAVLVYLLLVRLMSSPAKAGIVQTAFTVIFFLFGYFIRYEQAISEWRWTVEWVLFGLYGFYTIAVVLFAIVVVRAKTDLKAPATVLSVIAASILLMPTVSAAYYEAFVRERVERRPHPLAAEPAASGLRPDVYYIVLDAYSRDDVLETVYGVDNAPFLSALEARGFRVARHSRSNYLQTALSLGSSMNLNYYDDVARKTGDSPNHWMLASMIQDSEVLHVFRRQGYRFVNLPSGCYLTWPNSNADLEPSRNGVSNAEFESALFRMTPLARVPWFDRMLAIWATDERERVLFEFEALANVPQQPGPMFVFAHVVAPHPPFIFDENGNAPKYAFPMSGNDGSQFPGSRDYRYVACYGDQVRFVNGKVLETIDAILARYPEGERPIIILQGDHGGGSHYDCDTKAEANLWERSGILNAYLLPEGGRFELYDSITPVNTFRMVFNGLWDMHYELLDDRTYYAPWKHWFAFSEVSEAEIAAGRRLAGDASADRDTVKVRAQ